MKKDKFKPADRILLDKLAPHDVINIQKTNNTEKENFETSKKNFIKFFSLNELFYIENLPVDYHSLNSLNDFERFFAPFVLRELDLFKGIYKISYVLYIIEEVEYQEFNKLHEFLKDEKLYIEHSSLNRMPFINGFYFDKDTEVEFMKEKENPAISNLDLFTRLIFF
jgi:hypothetical protein